LVPLAALGDDESSSQYELLTSYELSRRHFRFSEALNAGRELDRADPSKAFGDIGLGDIGATDEVEVYVMETLVEVADSCLAPWTVDVAYFAVGFRKLDEVSWKRRNSATLVHFAPRNATALLGLPDHTLEVKAHRASLYATQGTDDDQWETATFVARITGEELSRIAKTIGDFAKDRPYYRAMNISDSRKPAEEPDSAERPAVSSGAFVRWVLDELAADGVTYSPLVAPKFTDFKYNVAGPAKREKFSEIESEAGGRNGSTTTAKARAFALALRECARPWTNESKLALSVDQLFHLLNKNCTNVTVVWPAFEFLDADAAAAAAAAAAASNLDDDDLDDDDLDDDVVFYLEHDHLLAPWFSAVREPHDVAAPHKEERRSTGDWIDWLLIVILIACLVAGARAFAVKTGCGTQFFHWIGAVPRTPLDQHHQQRRTRRANQRQSRELYERLQRQQHAPPTEVQLADRSTRRVHEPAAADAAGYV